MAALDSSWYRVAGLKPRLRAQAQVHRHVTRAQVWFVRRDAQSGRFFRLSPAANLILCLMDGKRSVEEIFQVVEKRHGAERPTRAETMQLLVQLHQADLLHAGLPPDMAELDRRAERQERQKMLTWLRNPMAMRFPLCDPDRFLDVTAPALRWIPAPLALLVWIGLMLTAGMLAVLHWDELSANVSDRVLAGENILLIALIYPVAKLLHELGHAYAIKLAGGEVHEMGIMMLVFFPAPYVDASASSAWPEKWRRALAAAAGMLVEATLAALAMIAWVYLEPGLARACAFNVMILCGISTIVFNGNPLLRFDGYYILCDLIEIPNLDTRSKRHLLYLIRRYAFGLTRAVSPVRAPGEGAWFVVYGLAAFVYRMAVMLGIALLVASQFFILGVLLAAWSVVQLCVWPVLKGIGHVISSQELRPRRGRAIGVCVAAVMAGWVLLVGIPLPHATIAEGVVWVPDEAALRTDGDGFLVRLIAQPGSTVQPGDLLAELEDPVATGQVEVFRAELAALQSRFLAVNLIDRVQTRLVEEQLERAAATLARAEQRKAALQVRAARAGRFVVPDARRLPGRFLRKGELIGYVIGDGDVGVRVVVAQADIDLVRQRISGVAIRYADAIGLALPAQVLRQTPSALDRSPAPGLASEGGGPIVLDPASPGRDRPLDRFYEIELAPIAPPAFERIGAHVYARFDHGTEALIWRALRGGRQLILRALDV